MKKIFIYTVLFMLVIITLGYYGIPYLEALEITSTPNPASTSTPTPTITPTSTPTSTPQPIASMVTAHSLVIRKGPGTSYPVAGWLQNGASIVTYQCQDDGAMIWANQVGGGWVLAEWLDPYPCESYD